MNHKHPKQYDERNIMFSRNELVPGTEHFKEYYRNNPEKKSSDDAFRKLPGILSPDAFEADPVLFASADASFAACENLHGFADGPVAEKKAPLSMEGLSQYLKRWALKLGAHSSGITKLHDYHIYTTGGRRERYGIPVNLNHTHAIAFTVEMDKEAIGQSPQAPTIMESAQQYLNAGTIAVQIAACLRFLGYPSRAHTDANYQVICPIVAKEAGLGEIGRMGILMTPRLGPRVRLGVVTTEAPLIADTGTDDNTVIDFCGKCKKCAEVCPSQAISHDDRKNEGGVLRWTINHEKCFKYWCKAGTDCARCMATCPYAHPDTFWHNIVRFFVRRSSLFRRVAAPLDDLFYGKKPRPKPLEEWQKVKETNE